MGALCVALAFAGCASVNPPTASTTAVARASLSGSGRMSLRIDGTPPQHFAAQYEIRGTPEAGEMELLSPWGSVLARARWTPHSVVLINGQQQREFASMEDMSQSLLGTSFSLPQLLLGARAQRPSLPGWEVEYDTRQRLVMRRVSPLPALELRIQPDVEDAQPASALP